MKLFARSISALAVIGPAIVGMASMVSSARAQSPGPSLVIDASTGAVLHEEQASQAWHPASTTKMMTAYVALRMVRARRIGLETPIPASKLAASQPRVKVYIKPGQEITLDNALKVMMVKSANDIAYVIAEGVGGTVPDFVAMMNAEARRLGMGDTVFRNPNGWHHPEQQTSARDLGILAMTMLREFPDYSDYWGIGAVQLGKVTLANTNGLIGRYAGANGFKTGFVCASGFNVVATATRGGRTLIAVVLGAYSGAERTVKGAQILDAAFATWGGGGRTVASIPASGTTARNICAEVRAFGRGAPLSDDADATGPISFTPAVLGDGDVMRAGLMPAAPSASMRASGGRITLGPRAQFAPIQIAYGRTSGSASAPLAANVAQRPSSAVAAVPARGPAGAVGSADTQTGGDASALATRQIPGAAPVRAGAIAGSAIAGTAIAGGAVAASAAAYAASRSASTTSDGPIRLHGAIGQGTPAPLRPSAAAGIRAPARGTAAPQTAALQRTAPVSATKPAAPKPGQAKPAAAKPAAAASATAKPAAVPPRRPPAAPATSSE